MQLTATTKRNIVITAGTFLLTALVVVPMAIVATRYPVVPNAKQPVTMDELAFHNNGADCWVAIDGKVYDLTAYLMEHAANPYGLGPYCGQDATVALTDKKTQQIPRSMQSLIATEFPQVGLVAPKATGPVAH